MDMEPEGTPEDSTKVVRMIEELDQFVQGGRRYRRTRRFQSGSQLFGNLCDLEEDVPKIEDEKESNSQTSKKDAELIAAKGKIITLKAEISSLERESKRARLEHERESTDFKVQIQRDQTDRNEILHKMRRATQDEESREEELENSRKELLSTKDLLKLHRSEYLREKTKLKESLEQVKDKAASEISDLKEKLERKSAEVASYQLTLEETEAKVNILKRKTNNMVSADTYREIQRQLELAVNKAKEADDKLGRIDESTKLTVKLQSDLSRLKEVEKQNQRLSEEVKMLKEGSENCLLLQEKLESALGKLKRADERIVDLQRIEIENEELKKKLESWEVVDESGNRIVRSPELLTKQISTLQKSQIQLKEDIGSLMASKDIQEGVHQKLSEKFKKVKLEYGALKSKVIQDDEEMQRLQRRLNLVVAERDSIRDVIGSVEQEIAGKNNSELIKRIQEAEQRASSFQTEIEKLEETIEEWKNKDAQDRQKIQELETELELAQIDTTVKSERSPHNQELRDQIESFKQENCVLKKTVLTLETELETKKLKGCYDPSQTKVLHMTFNPYTKRVFSKQEDYKQLKTENAQLKAALASIQGAPKDEKGAVGAVLSSSEEVKELTGKLESAQLKYKRLHEVFEDYVKQFREACYLLFGYRIDRKGTTKYQLYSMYAESSDDFFIFEYDSGMLHMVETEFSKSCQESAETYMFRYNSVPSFLSAITLELFSKQTMIVEPTVTTVTGK